VDGKDWDLAEDRLAPAAVSVSNGGRSISVRSSPDRESACPRSTNTSGSSPSCTTIWATSTTRPVASNRSTIHSGQGVTHVSGMNCHPCARNEPEGSGGPTRIRACSLRPEPTGTACPDSWARRAEASEATGQGRGAGVGFVPARSLPNRRERRARIPGRAELKRAKRRARGVGPE
jgi:hypothetical protein